MRLLSKHTVFCLALSGVTFLPVSARAADQNTYRAGQPYLKTSAANYGQCEQQCRGDAACRGWNFIRPNPRSASGICEFNARLAAPTQSPISVSGIISTSIDPLMSRAIPAGTNTVRIGAPTITKRAAAPQNKRPTIVRRQPVPTARQAIRPTSHTRPQQTRPQQARPQQTRQDVLKPRIYGGTPQQARAPQAQPKQNTAAQPASSSLTPEQSYYRDQYLAQKRAQEEQIKRRQASIPPRRAISPQGRPAPQQRPMQQRPMMQQRPAPSQRSAQMPAQMIAPRGPQQLPRPQMQAPQGQQGPASPALLYGSLHDDLTANMTAVPRPQTAPDNTKNPDAPLATSRAVPTEIIEVAPISPALPSLAGG